MAFFGKGVCFAVKSTICIGHVGVNLKDVDDCTIYIFQFRRNI